MAEPDYRKLYAIVCGGAADALDVLPESQGEARWRLLRALREDRYDYRVAVETEF